MTSAASADATPTWRRRGARTLAWAAAAVSLASVFLAYRDPALMVDLANRVWACF